MEPKLLIHVTYQAKPGRGREFVRQIVSQVCAAKSSQKTAACNTTTFSRVKATTRYFSWSSGKPRRIRPST